MAFARRMLAGDICKEALGLQGLPVPTAIAANTNDVTSRQIWTVLRSQGRRLVKPTRTHRWQALTREWQLATVPGQTRYDFPADFDSLHDLTAWNKDSRLPMLGPASSPQWQSVKVRDLGGTTFSITYRTVEDQLEIDFSPSVSQTLTLVYNSRAWVKLASSAPGAPVYADAPEGDGDIVMLDPEMMVAAVQYGFMSAKGFDTTHIAAMVDRLIESAINADTDAPVLSAAHSAEHPLLSAEFNVPDTGYGA